MRSVARVVRKSAECLAYNDVTKQIWLSLICRTSQFWAAGLQLGGFRAFATDLLTQICCCGQLCRDRLQLVICFPFSVLYYARLETTVSQKEKTVCYIECV